VIAVATLGSACTSLVGNTPTETSAESTSSQAPDTTARRCAPGAGSTEPLDSGSPETDALFLAAELFVCADDIVVSDSVDLNELAVAAQLAAALEAPLLLPEPRLAAEIGRLKPERVHLVGSVQVNTPPSAETIAHDPASAARATEEALGTSTRVSTPATPDASTLIETVHAISDRDRIAVPEVSVSSTTLTNAPSIDPSELVDGLARQTSAETLWVVDAGDPVTLLIAAAMGRTVNAATLAIDGENVLAHPSVGDAIAGREPGELRFVGPLPDASEWELSVLANGDQVPGGGFYVFPEDQKRRYVAFYGHPDTPALGALGEQGPIETLQRMQSYLDAYTGDGSETIPTFEMIASVASAGPTDDGDYSFEWPISTFQNWIDIAAENDVYVVLDLQSGREDFLSQAMFYEDLLKLPYVGLALDPEWRLAPDQVHLQQIGRVEAAEVNQVIEWLADLVRDNGLPQKMLIVHQFRTSMIQNREILAQRPELQLVIQMDGDGTEAQKDSTYETLLEGADDVHWVWGWKNFFDEDEPGPPAPESTMGKVPVPVYVSYQ
jgi:hypothetical protein